MQTGAVLWHPLVVSIAVTTQPLKVRMLTVGTCGVQPTGLLTKGKSNQTHMVVAF